jgi:hypothetical protein
MRDGHYGPQEKEQQSLHRTDWLPTKQQWLAHPDQIAALKWWPLTTSQEPLNNDQSHYTFNQDCLILHTFRPLTPFSLNLMLMSVPEEGLKCAYFASSRSYLAMLCNNFLSLPFKKNKKQKSFLSQSPIVVLHET